MSLSHCQDYVYLKKKFKVVFQWWLYRGLRIRLEHTSATFTYLINQYFFFCFFFLLLNLSPKVQEAVNPVRAIWGYFNRFIGGGLSAWLIKSVASEISERKKKNRRCFKSVEIKQAQSRRVKKTNKQTNLSWNAMKRNKDKKVERRK